MIRTSLSLITLLLALFAIAQTSDENFVTTHTARQAGLSNLPANTNQSQVTRSTTYFDGLGRSVQQVIRRGSPTNKDIVTFFEHDEFGRQNKAYLPYTHSSQSSGDFVDLTTAKSRQDTYYTGRFGTNDGDHAYSLTEFEASPLNRVKKQLAPGNAWLAQDRGVSMAYQTNLAADNVISWKVTDDGFPYHEAGASKHYAAAQLLKNATTDEDGNTTVQFADKLGRTVLKEVQMASGDLRTYYIYDDFGRLAFVMPPKCSEQFRTVNVTESHFSGSYLFYESASSITTSALSGQSYPLTLWVKPGESLTLSDPFVVNATSNGEMTIAIGIPAEDTEIFMGMAYQYRYDARGRMIAKKIPDADWVYMVYDQWDRLVLTQDGNQRLNDQWTFTSYDALNRPVITGFVTDSRSHPEMIDHVMGLGASDRYLTYNSTGAHGYNNGAYPFKSLGGGTLGQVLTVTYYDNYDFLSQSGWSSFSFTAEQGYNSSSDLNPPRGQATGGKTLILGTTTYLNNSVFYDNKYRVIQTKSHDPDLNIVRTTSTYSFTGDLLSTKTNFGSAFSKDLYQQFSYDHMSRLEEVELRLGSSGAYTTISEQKYSEIGELIEKNLHKDGANFLQSTDYAYNIRGWLTSINNADLNSDGTSEYGSTDVYGMALYYNSAWNGFHHFNGNIGIMKWSHLNDSDSHQYGFDYDEANRLKKADYAKNGTWGNILYEVDNITYDRNGNIETLRRRGANSGGGLITLDDLIYTYGDAEKSNQLVKVLDNGDDNNGFKDGVNNNTEYTYDANGNMISDSNKGISSITYNHLNLPETVTINGKTVAYDYLADGTKVEKRVTDGGDTDVTKYQGGLVFSNDVFDHLLTAEGKITPIIPGNNTYLDHQYFMKDHLGNVRTVISDPETFPYLATMETENASSEEHQFSNVSATRQLDAAHAKNGNEFSSLSNAAPLGPAIALNVHKGDEVDLSVWGKTRSGGGNGNEETLAGFVSSLVSAFTTQNVILGETSGALNSGMNSALTALGAGGNNNTSATGYLNYLVFDKDFNYDFSGFVDFTSSSYTQKSINNITIDEDGYLIAFLTYESSASDRVAFDDFSVTLRQTTVLQQDDYYPFGLTFNSYSSGTKNNYQYNQGTNDKTFDTERQPEIQVDMSKFRTYDYAIGRWWQADPAADKEGQESWTPYQYGFNNPLRYSDPFGDCIPCLVTKAVASFIGLKTKYSSIASKANAPTQRLISETSGSIPSVVNVDSRTRTLTKVTGTANDVNQVVETGKELGKEIAGDTGKALSNSGDALTGTGLAVSAVPGGQAVGAAMVATGETLSLAGTVLEASVDISEGNLEKAAVDGLIEGVGGFTSGGIKKLKSAGEIHDLSNSVLQSFNEVYKKIGQFINEEVNKPEEEEKTIN